jgi:hypothetical protein
MASPLDLQGKDREGLPASRLVRVVLLPVALHRPVGLADHHLPVDHRLPAPLVDHLRPAPLADLVDHLLPADPAGRRSTVPAIRWAGHPARASCR